MILDVLAADIPNHRDDFTILICKHILGETSEQENRRTENWLAKNEANRDRYNEIKLILDSLHVS